MEEISPLKAHNRGSDDTDDYVEDVSPSGCACFKFFSFKNQRTNDNEYKNLLNQGEENREEGGWWVEKLRKVKETTELIAGPKWKTFIRKIGGYFNNKRKQRNNNKFQYDPQSYALNFDGGVDQEEDDDDGLIRGFSARFAPPFSDDKQRGSSGL